jgi:hypothetical protein
MASLSWAHHGPDVDRPGIGKRIAEVASEYGGQPQCLYRTPLPGTVSGINVADDRIALTTSLRIGSTR